MSQKVKTAEEILKTFSTVSKVRNILYLPGLTKEDLDSFDQIFEEKFTEVISDEPIKSEVEDFIPLPKKFISLQTWPKQTNIPCWQCDCTFKRIPKFVTGISFKDKSGNNAREVIGCFCSFVCAKSYITDKYKGIEYENKILELFDLASIFTGKSVVLIPTALEKTQMEKYNRNKNGISEEEFQKRISELEDKII